MSKSLGVLLADIDSVVQRYTMSRRHAFDRPCVSVESCTAGECDVYYYVVQRQLMARTEPVLRPHHKQSNESGSDQSGIHGYHGCTWVLRPPMYSGQ